MQCLNYFPISQIELHMQVDRYSWSKSWWISECQILARIIIIIFHVFSRESLSSQCIEKACNTTTSATKSLIFIYEGKCHDRKDIYEQWQLAKKRRPAVCGKWDMKWKEGPTKMNELSKRISSWPGWKVQREMEWELKLNSTGIHYHHVRPSEESWKLTHKIDRKGWMCKREWCVG